MKLRSLRFRVIEESSADDLQNSVTNFLEMKQVAENHKEDADFVDGEFMVAGSNYVAVIWYTE